MQRLCKPFRLYSWKSKKTSAILSWTFSLWQCSNCFLVQYNSKHTCMNILTDVTSVFLHVTYVYCMTAKKVGCGRARKSMPISVSLFLLTIQLEASKNWKSNQAWFYIFFKEGKNLKDKKVKCLNLFLVVAILKCRWYKLKITNTSFNGFNGFNGTSTRSWWPIIQHLLRPFFLRKVQAAHNIRAWWCPGCYRFTKALEIPYNATGNLVC